MTSAAAVFGGGSDPDTAMSLHAGATTVASRRQRRNRREDAELDCWESRARRTRYRFQASVTLAVVPRRILLVEDSASTRSLARAILEASTFSTAVGPVEVTEAQSGFDAMRLLPRARYDLIITDINMPDVNGLELIHFIRRSEQYRSTPLVIISTQATERDIERGRKLGADAYVPKPFTAEALRDACEQLLLGTVARPSGAPANEPGQDRPSAPPSGSGR